MLFRAAEFSSGMCLVQILNCLIYISTALFPSSVPYHVRLLSMESVLSLRKRVLLCKWHFCILTHTANLVMYFYILITYIFSCTLLSFVHPCSFVTLRSPREERSYLMPQLCDLLTASLISE